MHLKKFGFNGVLILIQKKFLSFSNFTLFEYKLLKKKKVFHSPKKMFFYYSECSYPKSSKTCEKN